MKNFVADIGGLKELGGAEYLVKLQLSAIATSAARDYAQLIHDLAVRRALIGLGATISDKARAMRDDVSPDDQIVEAESDLFQLASTGKTSSGFKSFLSALHEAVTTANAAHKRQGKLAGISTGLVDMDRMLGGLHNSDLLILAGRPSMGKTSLATNIAFNVAKAFARKAGARMARGHGRWRRRGLLQPRDVVLAAGAADPVGGGRSPLGTDPQGRPDRGRVPALPACRGELEHCPLYIDDTPALPISQVAARARRLKRSPKGLDLLIIDYLQLVRPATAKDSRVNEVSEITQGLKAIAKELDIPVIALSQLSRQVETARTSARNCRTCGNRARSSRTRTW
jgi:replicative DNA helicase